MLKSRKWSTRALNRVLYILWIRYNNSPTAEQHIQQPVPDLPVGHQCICRRLPLGVHRYEERRLVCLPVTLSVVFLCPSATDFQLLHKGIRNKRDSWCGWHSWSYKKWCEMESKWVGKAFSSSLSFLIFRLCIRFSGMVAWYSRVASFLNSPHSFNLLDPHPFFFIHLRTKFPYLSVDCSLPGIFAKEHAKHLLCIRIEGV